MGLFIFKSLFQVSLIFSGVKATIVLDEIIKSCGFGGKSANNFLQVTGRERAFVNRFHLTTVFVFW